MANKSTLLLVIVLAFLWSKYNKNGNHFRTRTNLLENYDYVIGRSVGLVFKCFTTAELAVWQMLCSLGNGCPQL